VCLAVLAPMAAPVAVASAPATGPASATAPPGTTALSASVSPAEVPLGSPATVAGVLTSAAPGTLVLQSEPYPYRGFVTVARTVSAAEGHFTFPLLRADRNTRLRVLLEGSPPENGALLTLVVDPRVKLASRSLGPGRALLSIRMRHGRFAAPRDGEAWWFVRAQGASVFELAAVTAARELRPGLLDASATVEEPSRRFTFRVCVNPSWEAAMGPASAHGRCPDHPFVLHGADAR